MNSQDHKSPPRHVAVIMDGNGRWASQHGKRRAAGHRAGLRATRVLVEDCVKQGVEVLTLFAFSSENWKRPKDEVNSLMRLFVEALRREIDELDENNVRLRFVGNRSQLPSLLIDMLQQAEIRTRDNQGLQLVLAVAFGGRWDIVQAAQEVAARAQAGQLKPEDIDEEYFASITSLSGLPEPDLLIRTGGEKRISNFLLWDAAYTELYFTDVLWPEFGTADLLEALAFFAQRQRRFGRTAEQIESEPVDVGVGKRRSAEA